MRRLGGVRKEVEKFGRSLSSGRRRLDMKSFVFLRSPPPLFRTHRRGPPRLWPRRASRRSRGRAPCAERSRGEREERRSLSIRFRRLFSLCLTDREIKNEIMKNPNVLFFKILTLETDNFNTELLFFLGGVSGESARARSSPRI